MNINAIRTDLKYYFFYLYDAVVLSTITITWCIRFWYKGLISIWPFFSKQLKFLIYITKQLVKGLSSGPNRESLAAIGFQLMTFNK